MKGAHSAKAYEALGELRRKALEDRVRGRKLDLGDGPSGPLRPEVAQVIEIEVADRSVGLCGGFVVETVGGVEYLVTEYGEVLDVEGDSIGRAEWASGVWYGEAD